MAEPDTHLPSDPPPPPLTTAPPTVASPVSVRTTWPTVLGIISILLGALALCSFLCGIGGTVMLMVVPIPDPRTAAIYDTIRTLIVPLMLSNGLNTLVAGWLVAIGIGLLQRRPWVVRHANYWAMVTMLLVVLLIALQVTQQVMQTRAMATVSTPGPPPPPESVLIGMAVVTAAIWLVLGWTWPIFLLIWLRRAAIRREVDTWSAPA